MQESNIGEVAEAELAPELELASELLEVQNDQELDHFLPFLLPALASLGRVAIGAVGRGLVRRAASSLVRQGAQDSRRGRRGTRELEMEMEGEDAELEAMLPAVFQAVRGGTGDRVLDATSRFVRLARVSAARVASILAERQRRGQSVPLEELRQLLERTLLSTARQQRFGRVPGVSGRVPGAIHRAVLPSAGRPVVPAPRPRVPQPGAGTARWVRQGNNLVIYL
ncbi:hypothetical protein [Corallococcus exercitus]|uniref:hypothetical protein n=1 Tax=Corallococcus exercitus TaxID=2316736 RepID=UPI0035D45A91